MSVCFSWFKNTKRLNPHTNAVLLATINLLYSPMFPPFLYCCSFHHPKWQNMCEPWHWICYPQTTEPQEPNNNDNDSTHPCLHCCEVSITGRLAGWLLPVSLTGKGSDWCWKSLRNKQSHQGGRNHLGPCLHLTPLRFILKCNLGRD